MNQAKILAPRRGLKSTMKTSEKATLVLAEGELFIEVDDESGLKRVKVGDGSTTYADLPYSLSADSANIEFDGDESELESTNIQDAMDELAKRSWTGTQAEYDAIVKKDKNTTYYITDPSGKIIAVIAANVYYDNTARFSISNSKKNAVDYGLQLTANTVQGAIDELAASYAANIQFIEMPEPGSFYANKIYQYIGETNANYNNGYFYKCEANSFLNDIDVASIIKASTPYEYTNNGEKQINYLISRTGNIETPVSIYIDDTLVGTCSAGNSFSGLLQSKSTIRLEYESAYPNSGCTFSVSGNGFQWVNVKVQGGGATAEEISYDNTESELEADNVQDAIDEIADVLSPHSRNAVKNSLLSNNVQGAIDELSVVVKGSIQVDELPTASESEFGKIYQYTGNTTDNYTNGYFYKCIAVIVPGERKRVEYPTYQGGKIITLFDRISSLDQSVVVETKIYMYAGAYANVYVNNQLIATIGDKKTYTFDVHAQDRIRIDTRDLYGIFVTFTEPSISGYVWSQHNTQPSMVLPIASDTTLGGIKVGNNLSIDSNGVLSAEDEPYELPVASGTILGGIKVGDNLSIDENGVLSSTGGQIIQVDSIPAPTIDLIGTIYQYTGETNSNFTNGYFYLCSAEGATETISVNNQVKTLTIPSNQVITLHTGNGHGWIKFNEDPSDSRNGRIAEDYEKYKTNSSYNFGVQSGEIVSIASTNIGGIHTITYHVGCIWKRIDVQPSLSLPVASGTVLGGIKVGANLSIDSTTGVLSAPAPYTLPAATSSTLGGVKQGSNVTIAADGTISTTAYSLPTATASILGGIKVGNNLSIDSNGVLSAEAEPYELPVASGTVLGGIKVGENLSIDENGVLSAIGGGGNIEAGMKVYTEGFNAPDYTKVLTTITTKGASFTATENCWLTGIVEKDTDQYAGLVYINNQVVAGIYSDSNNKIYYYPMIPIKKGDIITTHSDHGQYTLTIYANKSIANIESHTAIEANMDNTQDVSIGTIIPYMGSTAPVHYLSCDGSVYNILNYNELANFIKNEFGSFNYFGGDGINTFAVPDLRGEFLRGTGVNSHLDQGNGSDVGTHQDGTIMPAIGIDTQGDKFALYTTSMENSTCIYSKCDHENISDSRKGVTGSTSAPGTWSSSGARSFTARPTNTSVNWCIKAEPTNYLVNSIDQATIATMDKYSTEERCIGCWINGKPIYRKAIKSSISAASCPANSLTILDSIMPQSELVAMNIENMITNRVLYPMSPPIAFQLPYSANDLSQIKFAHDNTRGLHLSFINKSSSTVSLSGVDVLLILEYTKTTDAENSFSIDLLSNVKDLTLTPAEVQNIIDSIIV